MTITALYGGQPVAFSLNGRILGIILATFISGVFFIGSLAFALLAGVGLVLWNAGTVLYHLLSQMAADSLFVQGLALLIIGFLLLLLIGYLIRYLARAAQEALKGARP